MSTIQFTIDNTVATDALTEIKLRTRNDSITIETFLTDLMKSYAKRCRIRCLDIESLIDQTGL